MFGHAGAVLKNFHVAPEVLGIAGGPEVARVNGLRPLRTDMDAAALRIACRCQCAEGNCDCKRSHSFLQNAHGESPFSMERLYGAPLAHALIALRETRLLRLAAKQLPFE